MVCFCVFGKDVSVLKMFVFPVWGALGGAYSCLFGFGRFRCFVFFVFVFRLFRFVFV